MKVICNRGALLDALGARINAFNTLDQSVLQLQALPMNLGKSLDLFADVALNPAFPQDLVDLSIRQRVARIKQEQAQPTGAALRGPRSIATPRRAATSATMACRRRSSAAR